MMLYTLRMMILPTLLVGRFVTRTASCQHQHQKHPQQQQKQLRRELLPEAQYINDKSTFTSSELMNDVTEHFSNQEQQHQQQESGQWMMTNNTSSTNTLTAVIHVGPLKTGTSSIQALLQAFQETGTLGKDHYQYASMYYGKSLDSMDNARTFSDCFVPNISLAYAYDPKNYCDPTVLSDIHSIAAIQHSNVIVSSEFLSTDGIDYTKLHTYFTANWNNIHIIMYYRRYYDWLISFHNQGQKYRKVPDRKSILYVTKFAIQKDSFFEKNYVVTVMERYQQYFPKTNVHVIDMHGFKINDVRHSFFCGGYIPDSTNICQHFHQHYELEQQQIKTDKASYLMNKGEPLIYAEIAYYAKHAFSMVDYTEPDEPTVPTLLSRSELTNKMRQYYEVELGKDYDDFPDHSYECLSAEQYEALYEKSKRYEIMLFPNRSLEEFNLSFEKFKKKYCHINATIILQDHYDVWQTFFQSLKT